MRALLYADWCAVRTRRSLVLLLVSLVTSVAVARGTVEAISSQGPSALIAISAAGLLMMSGYFLLFTLFGVDEQNGWEAGRLCTLGVTARQVVRARYAFVALVSGALLVLAVPSEMVCLGVAEALRGNVPSVALPSAETLLAVALVAEMNLVLVAVQMAVVFALGMQLGRIALFLPYLVFFGAAPWMGDALAGLGAQAPGASPISLAVAACVVVGALVYLLCLRVAQVLYARREL